MGRKIRIFAFSNKFPMPRPFLNAEWRKLLMFNYAVDEALLRSYVPYGTELDLWNGVCYVSLVGFMFLKTRMLGIPIPFHINFEEVNLRFYVRHKDAGDWKRGVVFIREIVPKPALSLVANTLYGEHYATMPMRHQWTQSAEELDVSYAWKKGRWHRMQALVENRQEKIEVGSEEEFITEHYWGYTKRKEFKTSEYAVEHPRWEIYPVKSYQLDVDFGQIYGERFDFLSHQIPKSVCLAEGSWVKVFREVPVSRNTRFAEE